MKGLKWPGNAIVFNAMRASGPGGQNVNKVATAVELRFNIAASGLPIEVQRRLLDSNDRRVSNDGYLVIKAQRYRSQDRNREDALARLDATIDKVMQAEKPRVATRPGRAQREKRLQEKKKVATKKANRGPVKPDPQ